MGKKEEKKNLKKKERSYADAYSIDIYMYIDIEIYNNVKNT